MNHSQPTDTSALAHRRKTGPMGYAIALLVIALALLVRLAFTPVLGDRRPFLTLFGAIAIVSWLARWRPALFAAIVGYVGTHLLIGEPPLSARPFVLVEAGVYLFSAGLIIFFGEQLHRSRDEVTAYAVKCRDAEEAERRQKELLRVTVESIGDAVITTDAKGRVTGLNNVATSLTGWSQSEAASRPLDDVFRIVHERSREPVESPAVRSMREGLIVGLANHTILIAKDGTEHPIDDSAAPIRGDDGKLLGCVLVFRDVAERRRVEREMQESREMLRITLACIGDGVIVSDANGNVRSLNAEAERLTGWTTLDAEGKPLGDVFHIVNEKTGERVENPVERVIDQSVTDLANHTLLVSRDGKRTPIDDSAAPIREPDGPFLGAVLVFRDVAEQRAFHRAQAHLAAVVRYSADAILTKDLDGIVKSWNQGASELFGYSADEIIGTPIIRLLPPERLHEEAEILARIRDGQPSERLETQRVARDGRRIFVSINVSPLRDVDGNVIGASTIVHDITARKIAEDSLRESEQRFREMADAAPVLIWMSGTDRRCTWFNRQWLDFVGRPMEREIGDGWADNVHAEDANHRLETYVTKFDAREPFTMMYRLKRHDGQYRWLLDNGIPRRGPDGQFLGYIGSCVDITERRQAEESLREADRRKDEFLAVLSHELRNPLAPIAMAVEVMKRRPTSDPKEQELRNIIARQAAQLSRLLDDLLDVNRIRSGKVVLRRDRMKLDEAVSRAVESVKAQIDAKSQRLTVNLPREPVFLNADPARMAQVIANLLSNASKYTDVGGYIALNVVHRDGSALVSVRDSGIGINADQMSRIFDMFAQVNPALDRTEGGLGVGLALTRTLVELHGGHIEVQSEGPGKGSEFIVQLPVDKSAPPVEEPAPSIETTTLSPRRILVADDNVDSAEMLAAALRHLGHDVRVAHDGSATIDQADAFAPDVALLDIGMPRVNGYDVGRTLREKFGPKIQLVAITGWGQDADKRRATDAGFDHHLTKPVDLRAVERLLQAAPGAQPSAP